MNNRKENRYSRQLYASLRLESRTFQGVLHDVSENGLFVRCNQDFPVGAMIDIEIFMPDSNNAMVKGVVRRKRDMPEAHRKYGFGIELTEKDVIYRRFLRNVTGQSTQPPSAS